MTTSPSKPRVHQTIEERVEELLGRLTLEEKAGLLFQAITLTEPQCVPEQDGDPLLPGMLYDLVVNRHITHVNLLNVADPATQARWKNARGRARGADRSRYPGHGVERPAERRSPARRRVPLGR